MGTGWAAGAQRWQVRRETQESGAGQRARGQREGMLGAGASGAGGGGPGQVLGLPPSN